MTERELATVLAALRTFQEVNDGQSELVGLHEHFTEHKPLSNHEIDELCARLRQTSPAPIDRGLLECHQLLREVLEYWEKPDSKGPMLPEELIERCWDVIQDVNGFLEGQPPLPPIRVIAYVEGGIVQAARSNLPAEQIGFAICDHDDESANDEYVGCTEEEYNSLEFGIY